MSEPLAFVSAFMIGLLGSVHCLGMCGGIMGALTYAIPIEKRASFQFHLLLLSYNLGRIISYALAGALLGSISWLLQSYFPSFGTVMRAVAGIMLIAMGLYLADMWRILSKLELAGQSLWLKLQPAVKQLIPVKNPGQALLLGALWGWIPCGLIYSTLIWASAAPHWQQSGMLMFGFGLGTLPMMYATGVLADGTRSLFQSLTVRRIAGFMVILFGVWTLPLPIHQHHGGAHHGPGHEQHAPDHSEHMHHKETNIESNNETNNKNQEHHHAHH